MDERLFENNEESRYRRIIAPLSQNNGDWRCYVSFEKKEFVAEYSPLREAIVIPYPNLAQIIEAFRNSKENVSYWSKNFITKNPDDNKSIVLVHVQSNSYIKLSEIYLSPIYKSFREITLFNIELKRSLALKKSHPK